MSRVTEREVAEILSELVRATPTATATRIASCGEYADGPGLCILLDNGQHFDVAVVERISRRVHPFPEQDVLVG